MPFSARPWNPGLAQAEAVLGAIESAAQVQQRHQFFVWMQAYLGALVPHDVAVCGAYSRTRKAMHFEVFSSVVLPADWSAGLASPASTVMHALSQAWVARDCTAQSFALDQLAGAAASPVFEPLRATGLKRLLVHGVSRPQQPARLETLFVLLSPDSSRHVEAARMFSLLMPQLHATWLRVKATELTQRGPGMAAPASPRPGQSAAAPTAAASDPAPLTARELEILGLVRQGLSNRAIGDTLAISALTVKNHAQNIFRKLGVCNRTQAVARAISRHWLSEQEWPSHSLGG